MHRVLPSTSVSRHLYQTVSWPVRMGSYLPWYMKNLVITCMGNCNCYFQGYTAHFTPLLWYVHGLGYGWVECFLKPICCTLYTLSFRSGQEIKSAFRMSNPLFDIAIQTYSFWLNIFQLLPVTTSFPCFAEMLIVNPFRSSSQIFWITFLAFFTHTVLQYINSLGFYFTYLVDRPMYHVCFPLIIWAHLICKRSAQSVPHGLPLLYHCFSW